MIGSFLLSSSNSDNLIVSLDRERRRHMISESEEDGKVQILPTLIPPHIDNAHYESGPNFYFQQVLNDVTTPLTIATPTPTIRR